MEFGESELSSHGKKTIVQGQIITVAVLFGAVNVLAILGFIKFTGDEKFVLETQLDGMAMIGVGAAVMGLIGSFVVPGLVTHAKWTGVAVEREEGTSRGKPNERQALGVFISQLIVGHALLEGPLIICAIFFFAVSNSIALPIAAAVLLVALAARFPTNWKVQSWLEERSRSMYD